MKTVSFETAKKLIAAGWDKQTAWRYNHDGVLIDLDWIDLDWIDLEDYPAPTLDELLGEMPASIGTFTFQIYKYADSGYFPEYANADRGVLLPMVDRIHNGNPAEAVALLWLKLRKEKLI